MGGGGTHGEGSSSSFSSVLSGVLWTVTVSLLLAVQQRLHRSAACERALYAIWEKIKKSSLLKCIRSSSDNAFACNRRIQAVSTFVRGTFFDFSAPPEFIPIIKDVNHRILPHRCGFTVNDVYVSNDMTLPCAFYDSQRFFYEDVEFQVSIVHEEALNESPNTISFVTNTYTLTLSSRNFEAVQRYVRECVRKHEIEAKRITYDDPKMFVLERVRLNNDESITGSPGLDYIVLDYAYDETFDNKFFTAKRKLRDLGKNFVKNRSKHYELGVSHTLGICLHGVPGSGKTSAVKAFCADRSKMIGTPVHIIIVNVSLITNVKVLRELFISDYLNGVYVHHDRRVYVLEEIDCSNWRELIKSRELQKKGETEEVNGDECDKKAPVEFEEAESYVSRSSSRSRFPPRRAAVIHGNGRKGGGKRKEGGGKGKKRGTGRIGTSSRHHDRLYNDHGDDGDLEDGMIRDMKSDELSSSDFPLTLAQILETLDGMIKRDGHVIFMTTNYLRDIDAALLRPGRFDAVLEFGHLSKNDIGEMYRQWFDGDNIPECVYDKMKDRVFTQADIGCIFSNQRDIVHRLLCGGSLPRLPSLTTAFSGVRSKPVIVQEAADDG